MRRFNIFLIICLAVCSHFQAAFGTTVLSRSVDDLARTAPVVIHGKVVRMEVNSHSGRRTALVRALDVTRGAADFLSRRDFYVPLLNRAFPHRDLVETVASAPELKVGEEVVLFLRPIPKEREGIEARTDGRRIFALEGFHQGKLKVVRDKNGVRRVATWSDWPDRPLTPSELQAQKTTARMENQAPPPIPAELFSKIEQWPTLDSVLNLSRESRVNE